MTVLRLPNRVLGEGDPALVVPLMGATHEHLVQEAAAAVAACPDLVEWRLDPLLAAGGPARDPWPVLAAVAQALRGILSDLPLLLTVRTAAEGGEIDLDDARYAQLISALVGSGWGSAVDIEALGHTGLVAELAPTARAHGIALLASHHRFDGTPPPQSLDELLRSLAASGADIVKLAVTPDTPQQVLDLLQATRRAADELSVPVITMSMGPLGAVSRLAGAVTGSAATFAALGTPSAPGQLPVTLVRAWQEAIR